MRMRKYCVKLENCHFKENNNDIKLPKNLNLRESVTFMKFIKGIAGVSHYSYYLMRNLIEKWVIEH